MQCPNPRHMHILLLHLHYKLTKSRCPEESKGCQIEKNDFELIRELIKRVKHPVIGEGNINTPQKLKRVMEIGVYSVVIGSAITRPQLITKKFTDALKE